MQPVECGVARGHVEGAAAGRQREEVARLPLELRCAGHRGAAGAPHHEEELARRIGVGVVGVARADMHEVGAQPRRRCGPRADEIDTRVERERAGHAPFMQIGSELGDRDRRQRAVGERIRRVAVVVEPGRFGEPLDGRVTGGWNEHRGYSSVRPRDLSIARFYGTTRANRKKSPGVGRSSAPSRGRARPTPPDPFATPP